MEKAEWSTTMERDVDKDGDEWNGRMKTTGEEKRREKS